MSFDYLATRADAEELLTEFGRTMALNVVTTTSNAATAGTTGQSVSSVNVVGVLLDFSDREKANTNITEGDRKAIIAVGTLAVAPKLADTLTVGSETFAIKECKTLSPAGVDVTYTLRVGK